MRKPFIQIRWYNPSTRQYEKMWALQGPKGDPGETPSRSMLEEIASEEISKVVDGAPTAYNTLKKIADWISSHTTKTTSIETSVNKCKSDITSLTTSVNTNASGITTNANAISALATRVSACESSIQTNANAISANASSISTINSNISTLSTKVGQTLKVVSFDSSTGALVAKLMD